MLQTNSNVKRSCQKPLWPRCIKQPSNKEIFAPNGFWARLIPLTNEKRLMSEVGPHCQSVDQSTSGSTGPMLQASISCLKTSLWLIHTILASSWFLVYLRAKLTRIYYSRWRTGSWNDRSAFLLIRMVVLIWFAALMVKNQQKTPGSIQTTIFKHFAWAGAFNALSAQGSESRL